MNLAKALKTKKRMTQKIASLQTEIQTLNSIPEGQDRKINVNDLMDELTAAIKNLVKLKILIFTASIPMRETILMLAETKSRISFLKDIDTHEGKGKQTDYSSHRTVHVDSEANYEVAFDMVWVRDEVKECEDKIDQMQDELDVFNHKTAEIEL